MRRRTSFNARSRVEFTRFIWVRPMTGVGGCFLLVFCFWRICISSCTELEGIFCDCALLLLLLYFRLTCFHLESVSVALLFSQERSTPRLRLRAQLRAVWGGGERGVIVTEKQHFVDIKLVSVSFASSQAAATAADIIYRCFLLHISGLNHKKMFLVKPLASI